MRNIIFISIIVMIFFGGVYLLYRSTIGDLPDLIEALQIPRYESATSWEIKDTSGYPDSFPHAEIIFKTGQKPEQVTIFYKTELTQKGWRMVKIQKLYNDRGLETGEYTSSFKKGNVTLSLDSQYFKSTNQNWNYKILIIRDKN